MDASPESQFNRVARAYASSAVHARGQDLEWLVAALQPRPTWHVLDAGTGAGHTALLVAATAARVTAVDLAEHMLRVAAELAVERGATNVDFVQASIDRLPFADSTFDAACTRYSAHHWSDPRAAVTEIARVLKPGAPFVLSDSMSFEDPALDTYLNTLELLRDASHVRNATVAAWSRLLEDAGLAATSVKPWSVTLDTETWLARSDPPEWRASAARHLLRDASPEARSALSIGDRGESFTLPCAVIAARRLG